MGLVYCIEFAYAHAHALELWIITGVTVNINIVYSFSKFCVYYKMVLFQEILMLAMLMINSTVVFFILNMVDCTWV